MKFKSIACPGCPKGLDFSKSPDLVVPNQGMSLEEILVRFVRREALPVGNAVHYGSDSFTNAENLDDPLNIDMEKMSAADLTEKAEYNELLNDVKSRHEKSESRKAAEKAKADQNAAKLAEEKRIRIAAQKLAKGKFGKAQ